MSDCSDPEILQAYEEVRSDKSPINWMLITYKEGTNQTVWTLVGKGEGGFQELSLTSMTSSSAMVTSVLQLVMICPFVPGSVFIKYIAKGTRMNIKAKMNIHRGDVEKVINQISISFDADSLDELDEDEINARLFKAGGAHYN
ncbi:cofilin/tropomyosin-type actin-binding protein [Histomonas meleagridis]|nr:cofilin/tropomyosin-type actin-binding protein [Histomonas meleagridis]